MIRTRKKLVYLFYELGPWLPWLGQNIATHAISSGVRSTLPGIAYAGVYGPIYSILKHANLGENGCSLRTPHWDAGPCRSAIDWVFGYEGWSVTLAVPATILFADVGVVFLLLVNRLNFGRATYVPAACNQL